MYHSWNFRKLLRYAVLDLALILAAVFLTHFGREHFAAVNRTGGVFLPVLLYHSVTDLPETDFCISPETFESDLQYLQENGYETVSTEDLIAYTAGTGTLPPKLVLLTFDDGLYNQISTVLPLLEAYHMCAIVTVVGAFADVFAPDAPHNDAYSYLTWQDLQ
ncbi:MAG: polysaccharide deacetylase family protein [Ruminococcus sp.]|nr:polysaccharide deacetylase family protein [Ruminococcus sp.]